MAVVGSVPDFRSRRAVPWICSDRWTSRESKCRASAAALVAEIEARR